MDNITIDIIVPCYNEENNVRLLLQETEKVAQEMTDCQLHYIFVDDGSTDGTLDEIKELAATNKRINYIALSRNFGKEAAMYAGIRNSRGNYAAIIDADLQHPPSLLLGMMDRIRETGCDCCAARRVTRKGEPKIRSLCARMFYKIMNHYSDIDIVDGAVDFRLMSRQMVKAIASINENQRFSKGLFAWVGFNTEWIEFENVDRISGESKWNMLSLMKYAVDGFIDFTTSPLKYLGLFGGIITVGSALYLIIEIIKTLVEGKDTPGYASILCLILFFGGLTVMILSIIGEYMGRIYMESKGRPVYIERETDLDEE